MPQLFWSSTSMGSFPCDIPQIHLPVVPRSKHQMSPARPHQLVSCQSSLMLFSLFRKTHPGTVLMFLPFSPLTVQDPERLTRGAPALSPKPWLSSAVSHACLTALGITTSCLCLLHLGSSIQAVLFLFPNTKAKALSFSCLMGFGVEH